MFRKQKPTWLLALSSLASVLLLCFVGCGPSEEKLDLVPASGTLTYKGKELSGYHVYFQPDGDLRPARAVTDEQGHFVLGTGGEANGALAGDFSVYIILPPEDLEVEAGREEVGMTQQRKSALPKKYETPATSGIKITIPAGGSDALDITL